MLTSLRILAGMPSIRLTDVTALRVDAISFFLLGVLLAAWGVQTLWNLLSRDLPKLPHIRYSTALAGTILWGLLFMLVLTMISGARELMTPGAWDKVGYTYELQTPPKPDETELLPERRTRLELLRAMLWSYRASNDGQFPESINESGIAAELWKQPGAEAVNYGYNGKVLNNSEPVKLIYEFDVYQDHIQLVLMSDGSIQEVTQFLSETTHSRNPIQEDSE